VGVPATAGRKRTVTGFTVLVLFMLAFAIFCYKNFKTVVVSGISMVPTFKDGQRVLVSHAYWLVGPIRRKDIVVLRDSGPTGYIIKRVYRMGGDKVDWENAPESHRLTDPPFVVPDGELYVLGDNRLRSEDSRKFGPVPLGDVLGKVVVRP
jgi:signal peptidase I